MSNNTDLLPGGWTPYHPLSNDDRKVFDEAIAHILGVVYKPETVSTQVVAGENFRFKCRTTMPGPMPLQGEAIVDIFKPLKGAPHVTGIHRI